MSEAKQMITEDQLKKIQDFQKDLNKLLNEVGFLEAQKTSVLGKFHEVNKETEDFKKELEKEYGSININLEDGSFTPIEKEEEDNCPSNCGTITDDEILTDCYSLSIQNECSNNIETYCFDYDVWMDNYVGGNFCVYNVDSW